MSDAPASTFSSAWQRWKASALDASLQPTAEEASVQGTTGPAEPEVIDPRQILAQWKRQAEQEGYQAGLRQGIEDGRQKGHAAGYEAGLAAARTQDSEEKSQLAHLLEQSSRAIGSLHEELGQAVISLSLSIARDVVRTELSARPEVLLPMIDEIMRSEPGTALRMWLHPDDLTLVKERLGQNPDLAQCRLLPDATLSRGGCRVQTAHSDIDATLQTRWRQVAGALGSEKSWAEGSE